MIYGIGVDLVELARIGRILEKYGERFARRILAEEEWPAFLGSHQPAVFLAKRFTAKEAFSKAAGTGLRHPVNPGYISVLHDALGKPCFGFHPELDAWMRNRGITSHHLSITDETGMACAFVILEK